MEREEAVLCVEVLVLGMRCGYLRDWFGCPVPIADSKQYLSYLNTQTEIFFCFTALMLSKPRLYHAGLDH